MTHALRDYQRAALDSVRAARLRGLRSCAVVLPTGVGKGHPLDTEVPTPSGIRLWGDLYVGDQVLGSDGSPTRVTAIYDRGVLPSYRVTFSDGASVIVDGDHLWSIKDGNYRRTSREIQTVTTEYLAGQGLKPGRGFRFRIPITGLVDLPDQDLPLDPYVVGSLIANGGMTSHGTYLTTPDQEVAARCARAVVMNKVKDATDVCDRYGLPGLVRVTEALGMRVRSANKRIPQVYLLGSIDQRVALLQGLMDGDGSRRGDGRRSVLYHTTSPGLAQDVRQLVTSLGGTGVVRCADRGIKGTEYTVGILLPGGVQPFGTARKSGEHGSVRNLEPKRAIVSIEPAGDHRIRCIQVEAKDSLYLITRDHVVTHNTTAFCAQAAEHIADRGGRVLVVVDRLDLVDQTLRTLAKVAPHLSVGVVRGRRSEAGAQVVISMRQSLGADTDAGRERRDSIRDVGLIIVDECDLAAAPQYARIIAHYAGAFVTGYTATFMRADGKALGKIFEEIVYERDIRWAIEGRHLIRPFGRSVEVPDLHLMSRRGDWTNEQVGDALAESLAPSLVVDKWLEEASGRKTLAFTPTVATARLFEAEFRARGVWAETIHGGTPRAEQLAMHERHKPGTVLINCMLLTVGFDKPDIDCVLVIRMTKNQRLYIQMAGRGLRVDPARPYDEQDCLIMNVSGQDIPSLSGVSVLGLDDPEEQAARKAALDLTDLLDDGGGIEQDEDPFYDGVVEVVDFDPISGASAHVWLTTDGGIRFLPASKDAFVFLYPRPADRFTVCWCSREGRIHTKDGYGPGGWSTHADLPLGQAMTAAERYVKELLGGSVRSSRRDLRYVKTPARPSWSQRSRAEVYGVPVPRGITGPELSDLLDSVQGSRRIDPLVNKFRRNGR